MLTQIISVAARGVVRDAQTNNISIFSILEQINPTGFPLFISDLAVLFVWSKAPGDPEVYDTEFVVRNNAIELMRRPYRIDFAGAAINRSIVSVQGLVVREPGALRFSTLIDDAEVAHYHVAVSAPPTVAQPVET